jgi:hypothetical protein
MRGRAVAVAGPGSSLAITGLGRVIIGQWQLTAEGLFREPAELDDARPDTYVKRSASHGVPVRRFWRRPGPGRLRPFLEVTPATSAVLV